MRFEVVIPIKRNYREIFAGFNRELFLALAPSFPPNKLLRFDGCAVGDEVHIALGVFPLKQTWISVITEFYTDENEIYFIDEGKKLPTFLTFWRHKHRIIKIDETNAQIIEEVTFETAAWAPKSFTISLLKRTFTARTPVYQKIFNKK